MTKKLEGAKPQLSSGNSPVIQNRKALSSFMLPKSFAEDAKAPASNKERERESINIPKEKLVNMDMSKILKEQKKQLYKMS